VTVWDRLLPSSRSLENANVPITSQQLASLYGMGSRTAAGVNVTQTSALRLVPVLASIRLIAETISTLPIGVFVKDGPARREVAPPGWVEAPNDGLNQQEMVEECLASLLTDGNEYAHTTRDRFGEIVEVFPLAPRLVTPDYDETGIVYRVPPGLIDSARPLRAAKRVTGDILHIRGFRAPGQLKGLSPIEYARQAIGLGLAAEQFGAEFFGQGAHPSGVLEVPGEMTTSMAAVLLDTWKRNHSGMSNSHEPAVLTGGMQWKTVTIPPEDAQFIATRGFQTAEVARIYRVPPHMIGDVEKSTSWGTGIEEQAIGFVVHTLRPWIVRLETAISRLLPAGQFLRFNVSGLLRGSQKERYAAYAQGRSWSWLSVNDVLALEDMQPVDGGDERIVPSNHTRLGDDVAIALWRRSQAVLNLTTAGYDPAQALALVGLDPIDYTGKPTPAPPPGSNPDDVPDDDPSNDPPPTTNQP